MRITIGIILGLVFLVSTCPELQSAAVVAAGEQRSLAQFWSESTVNVITVDLGHTQQITSIAFSPNGKIIAAVVDDEKGLRLFNVETGNEIIPPFTYAAKIRKVAFSPDGQILAAAYENGVMILWNLQKGMDQAWNMYPNKLPRDIVDFGLQFCSDSRLLVVTRPIKFAPWIQAMAELSEINTHTRQIRLVRHWDDVYNAILSPDCTAIAIVNDYMLAIYNVETGQEIEIQLPYRSKSAPVLSHNSEMVTSSHDNEIAVWNAKTGDMIRTFTEKSNGLYPFYPLAFSPDNSLLAAQSHLTLTFFDMKSGKPIKNFPSIQVNALSSATSFSPDGTAFAAGSYGNILILKVIAGE